MLWMSAFYKSCPGLEQQAKGKSDVARIAQAARREWI
eukprot:COSAG06_NODE_5941_length_3197_cov_216.021304_2_plen_37_part_00